MAILIIYLTTYALKIYFSNLGTVGVILFYLQGTYNFLPYEGFGIYDILKGDFGSYNIIMDTIESRVDSLSEKNASISVEMKL